MQAKASALGSQGDKTLAAAAIHFPNASKKWLAAKHDAWLAAKARDQATADKLST